MSPLLFVLLLAVLLAVLALLGVGPAEKLLAAAVLLLALALYLGA